MSGILLNFLMIAAMVIWGGSWVSAKTISTLLPAEALTFWRFIVTFVSFIPVVFFLREPLRLDRKALVYTFLGSVFMGLYFYFFFKGLSYGFAGAAGVLVTTTVPLSTFALSVIFLGQKTRPRDIAGLCLGLIGGSILIEAWSLDAARVFTVGNVYFLLCALLWALLTICSQKAGESVSAVTFSLITYGLCSIPFFFLTLPHGLGAAFT